MSLLLNDGRVTKYQKAINNQHMIGKMAIVSAVFFNEEDFLINPISIVMKAMITNDPLIKINKINNRPSSMIFCDYFGKLYDNQVIKDIVRTKEVNEPNKRPHPISCILDFFGRFKVTKSPTKPQHAIINIIKE